MEKSPSSVFVELITSLNKGAPDQTILPILQELYSMAIRDGRPWDYLFPGDSLISFLILKNRLELILEVLKKPQVLTREAWIVEMCRCLQTRWSVGLVTLIDYYKLSETKDSLLKVLVLNVIGRNDYLLLYNSLEQEDPQDDRLRKYLAYRDFPLEGPAYEPDKKSQAEKFKRLLERGKGRVYSMKVGESE